MYVRICVTVLFTNWTGIVAEVKRGQSERDWGGCGERADWGSGALGEQRLFTSKTAYRVDKRSHTTAKKKNTPLSHTVSLLPLMR